MGWALSSDDLSKWIRQCFECPLVGQVKKNVLPGLEAFGGPAGLCVKLQTASNTGIPASEVKARREHFGSNYVEPEPPETIWMMAWNALQDPCLIFLCFAALVSFLVGMAGPAGSMEWLEGVAILCAVGVVVTVSAVNDYKKEQQFRALNAVKEDVTVTVIRDSQKVKVSTHDIVVGDVVLISTGDMVCADGVVFDHNDLGLSEAMLTGESVVKRKGMFDIQDSDSDEAALKVGPALFAGTFVQEGEGRMIVLAVGANTYQGLMEEKMKEDESEKSVLQQKLDDMTDLITKVGAGAGALTVAVLLVRFALAFYQGACCKESWDHAVHWVEALRFLVVGVTVFVVAVPEGLPLAVTIALAFSVGKMMADQNLVRHLSACETMGSATTICSDKTGTLTTGKMTVVRMMGGGEVLRDCAKAGEFLTAGVRQLWGRAMVVNTSFKSDVELDGAGQIKKYAGNDTECALLFVSNKMLREEGGYRGVREKNPMDDPKRSTISFSSDRKRMSTCVEDPSGGFFLYCKGASEVVLGLCTRIVRADGSEGDLLDTDRESLEKQIGAFADEGLRTLTIAYRKLDIVPADKDTWEQDLTLIGLVGLEDPVRAEVPAAIETCKGAGIVVRMVTGDNPRTAAAIARKCGILSADLEAASDYCIMTGLEFREKVVNDDETINQPEFDKIWPHLRVLARSSPLDKLTLVTGIQQSRIGVPQTVAVTGDGTNDAPALKRADVGFAMGQTGTQVAQNAADIIVMDDNFASIVQAVKWGRCVYDNICKFLQFQLTVNLTACAIAVVGSSILTESPLNVIQLLWVNMIMDSFASVALATEDPLPDLLLRSPYPRDQPLLSNRMIRQLVGHSGWQMFVLFLMIFALGDVCPPSPANHDLCAPFGKLYHDAAGTMRSGRPDAYDSQYYTYDETCIPPYSEDNPKSYAFNETTGAMDPLRPPAYCVTEHGGHTPPSRHFTILFTVFVMMQLFNQINSRKLHGEPNVFVGILDNKFFVAIMAMEFFMQLVMVELPGVNLAMGCKGLNMNDWLLCLFIGATEIPINFVIAYLPLEWFKPRSSIKGFKKGEDGQDKAEKDDVPMLQR
eukprot:CAMPEP_0173418082 /NCGR_PEP_ID=MMETSP1357-20121228/310_1 /TAXON_ID=77926 /ORGANISM="Hemiselmis rufescens, Strain PCC563" /LENGTH=1081 /DNA_ID=CAMNT_0014380511 /DNA_START=137 /DNA_END=3382 /DNA_ORIENTATION=-